MANNLNDAVGTFVANSGGSVQREQRGPGSKSKFVRAALEDWCLGLMSAAKLQHMASDLVGDGVRHPDVFDLSRIGTDGLNDGNCTRDLKRKFFKGVTLPKPYWLLLPILQYDEDIW